MENVFQSVLRQELSGIMGVYGDGKRPYNFALVGLVARSGNKFEFRPVSRDVGAKHELFEIVLEQVEKFSEVRKWPEGPCFEWGEIEAINDAAEGGIVEAIDIHITDGGLLDGNPLPAQSGFLLSMSNGARIDIRHSEAVPLSVEIRLVDAWAT